MATKTRTNGSTSKAPAKAAPAAPAPAAPADAQVVDKEAARQAKIMKACEEDYRVQAVREHAKANYEQGGWDVVLESMNAIDIYWVIYKARSSKGAISRMAAHVGVVDEVRSDITNA